MNIRPAIPEDIDAVWNIFQQVIKTGDTYIYSPNTQKWKFETFWFGENKRTYVAEINGRILGSYIIKPNQLDLGSHIANAAYMVSSEARGAGIGRTLCEHSLDEARKNDFKAMQFNIVVSTNTVAVKLWKKCGFKIIGTIPEAFDHSQLGLVDAHIMYRKL